MSVYTDLTDLVGPLTTIFTPPTGCLATPTYNPSAIWAPDYSKKLSPAVLYGATGQAPDLLCYPPKFTMDHVYSPGICPSGWTSACEPTQSGKKVFAEPTTGVQCCPVGFACSEIFWCQSGPISTPTPVWSVWTDKYGIEGVMTDTYYQNIKPAAKPIFVAYQASDQSVLAAAAANTSTPSNSPSPTLISGDGGLSGGSIAGIVIGSVVGGVLATVLFWTALVFCFGFRFSRNRNTGDSESHHELAAKGGRSSLVESDSQAKYGGGWGASELAPTQGAHVTHSELDTSATYGRAELAGLDQDGKP